MSSNWRIDGPLPSFFDDDEDVEIVVIRRDTNGSKFLDDVYHEIADDDPHRTKCNRPRPGRNCNLRRIQKRRIDDDRRLCKHCAPSRDTPERPPDPANAKSLAAKLDRMDPDDVSGVGGHL